MLFPGLRLSLLQISDDAVWERCSRSTQKLLNIGMKKTSTFCFPETVLVIKSETDKVDCSLPRVGSKKGGHDWNKHLGLPLLYQISWNILYVLWLILTKIENFQSPTQTNEQIPSTFGLMGKRADDGLWQGRQIRLIRSCRPSSL